MAGIEISGIEHPPNLSVTLSRAYKWNSEDAGNATADLNGRRQNIFSLIRQNLFAVEKRLPVRNITSQKFPRETKTSPKFQRENSSSSQPTVKFASDHYFHPITLYIGHRSHPQGRPRHPRRPRHQLRPHPQGRGVIHVVAG